MAGPSADAVLTRVVTSGSFAERRACRAFAAVPKEPACVRGALKRVPGIRDALAVIPAEAVRAPAFILGALCHVRKIVAVSRCDGECQEQCQPAACRQHTGRRAFRSGRRRSDAGGWPCKRLHRLWQALRNCALSAMAVIATCMCCYFKQQLLFIFHSRRFCW